MMKYTVQDSVLTLFPQGEINSVTAQDVEKEILSITDKNPCEGVVIDLSDIVYVSSAGLRIMLKFNQRFPKFQIINASLDVYDVFQMTGFTAIIDVRKKMRSIDVSNAELIGEGYFSFVYRIDKDTIIKVFRGKTPLSEVERELNLAKQAFVLGIPTAISFDVVRVGEQFGVVFEMLDCASLRDCFRDHPERYDELVEKYAGLLRTINTTECIDPTLPSAKQGWLDKLPPIEKYIDAAHFAKLRRLLENVEERNTFVHGDCHFKNIMVQGSDLLLIDMDTLSVGHPIFEFASIYAPYVAFEEDDPGNTGRFFGMDAALTQKMFRDVIAKYFGGFDESTYQKIALVAYAHMMWWNEVNTPDNIKRRNGNLGRLCALLDTIEDLNIG